MHTDRHLISNCIFTALLAVIFTFPAAAKSEDFVKNIRDVGKFTVVEANLGAVVHLSNEVPPGKVMIECLEDDDIYVDTEVRNGVLEVMLITQLWEKDRIPLISVNPEGLTEVSSKIAGHIVCDGLWVAKNKIKIYAEVGGFITLSDVEAPKIDMEAEVGGKINIDRIKSPSVGAESEAGGYISIRLLDAAAATLSAETGSQLTVKEAAAGDLVASAETTGIVKIAGRCSSLVKKVCRITKGKVITSGLIIDGDFKEQEL